MGELRAQLRHLSRRIWQSGVRNLSNPYSYDLPKTSNNDELNHIIMLVCINIKKYYCLQLLSVSLSSLGADRF